MTGNLDPLEKLTNKSKKNSKNSYSSNWAEDRFFQRPPFGENFLKTRLLVLIVIIGVIAFAFVFDYLSTKY